MVTKPQMDRLEAALLGPSKAHYEAVREELIEQHGYETFRDMQQEIFLRVFGQRDVGRNP